MSITDDLGELAYIDPKQYFMDEAKVFTPWVSGSGLGRLSNDLKMQLDLVGTEVRVGAFKADIVCEDPDYGTVLIENQLTVSDHKHAGQLITYVPGVDATTVVWIAPRFRPEHRAAIAGLNRLGESCDPQVRFFGVEIKLWRIGNSPPASQFVVVEHPDDWESPKSKSGPVKLPRDEFLEDYWTSLKNDLERSGCSVRLQAPKPQTFIDATLGQADCFFRVSISVQKSQTRVALVIRGEDAEAYGRLLLLQDDEIKAALGNGVELEWQIPPALKSTVISTASTGWDLNDPIDRSSQFEWFGKHLNEFDRVFRDRVHAIDPAEYTPDESDEEQDDPEEDVD